MKINDLRIVENKDKEIKSPKKHPQLLGGVFRKNNCH